MSFKFKPEDLQAVYKKVLKQGFILKTAGDFYETEYATQEMAAELNDLLQAHLATLPKVYGNFGINGHDEIVHKDRNPAHTALLWGITEIETKECEHEPELETLNQGTNWLFGSRRCKRCDIKLKAKWEKA